MKAVIISNSKLQGDYFEVVFTAPEIAEKAVAGQFVHIRIDERQDTILRRPFSIHATDPGQGTVSVAYKVVGKGTRAMSKLDAGYEFDVMGPLGRGFSAPPEDVIPVTDPAGKFAGIVRKKNISDPPPYRMILVDHNEPEQSIPGIEEIPVIEVVDHHRIGMLRTQMPIKFTGDVVGSTCTLVAGMFKSSGESLTPELAGVLLGGIVADTLNLKSPTTAKQDRLMLEWLEKISGVKAESLMEELSRIASPLAASEPNDVIESDRKSYVESSFRFSLSQVEETKFELLHSRKEELSCAMEEIMEKEQLHFIALLVTDAVRENSRLLILGNDAVLRSLPWHCLADGIFDLPGILSRKKQLLPQILTILADLKHA